MSAYASINGQTITKLRLTVGAVGPWFADCELDDEAAQVTGAVLLTISTLTLKGTVVAERSGVYGGARRVRVVAGGAGWGQLLGAKGYHNDAGVKAVNVAFDAAREAGEQLGPFAPSAVSVGSDYARQIGPASRALEDVIGDAAWWVDYTGLTNVGTRATSAAGESAYEVTDYDPAQKLVTLGVQDPATISVGSVLTKTLDGPQTVRDLDLVLDAGEFTVLAWCGSSGPQSRLVGLLQAIIARSTDGQLFGSYRYRVVAMSGARVQLQAVSKAPGLPDLIPLSMWGGVAGAHAELAPSAEVLVSFIAGDRTQPIVTGFVGKGGPGFVPLLLTLGDPITADFVSLAGKADAEIKRLWDLLTGQSVPPWVPVSMDGGAALQAAANTVSALVRPTAASTVKAS